MSAFDLLKTIGEELLQKESDGDPWKGSKYECINKLKPDYSGKAGELLVHKLCVDACIDCVYNGDINSKDGVYDILVDGKKIEIKTARLGKQGSFQHESLKCDGYDYLMFVDITPGYYYITILPKFDLSQRCEVMKRKPHLRDATHGVYKFDYGEKNLQASVASGHSLKIDESCSGDMIREFIRSRIGCV